MRKRPKQLADQGMRAIEADQLAAVTGGYNESGVSTQNRTSAVATDPAAEVARAGYLDSGPSDANR